LLQIVARGKNRSTHGGKPRFDRRHDRKADPGMIAIGDIYDAAFDRALFPRLLERFAAAFGAQAAFLGWSDFERGAGFQAQFGNDPLWMQRYVEIYAEHDVLRPRLHAVPEGQCAPAFALLQEPAIRDSLFYREYLAPQQIVDNLAVNLVKRPNIVAHFALLRSGTALPFSDDDCAALVPLIPHLKRAVIIQSHLLNDAGTAQGYRNSYRGRATHVLLLTGDQRIVEIDPVLAALLRLRVGDKIGDGELGNAVAATIGGQGPVAATIDDDAGAPLRLLCEARALPQERFGELVAASPIAHILLISRIDQPRPIAFAAMTTLYRLTPMEARVLRDAVEHGELTGIGERLGMAHATARTHLHRIYDKTQTSGFAGLTTLAHRFAHAWSTDDC